MINNNTNNTNQVVRPKDEYLKISLVNQGFVLNTKKKDPLADIPDSEIDYKNIELLSKYISERGKIISSRVSGVPFKKQRKLSKAIKRARNLALLSFISKLEQN